MAKSDEDAAVEQLDVENEVILSRGIYIDECSTVRKREPSVKRQRYLVVGMSPSIEPSRIVIPGGANFRALSFYLKVIELRYIRTRNEQLDILKACHM